MDSLKILKDIALKISEMDEKIVEVFIHSDSPSDPLKNEEVYFICHLLDPEITHDLDVFNDKGTLWSIEITEKIMPYLEELNIKPEIIIMPFNYKLYSQGEYGEYYITLYLKEGYTPVLETADQKIKMF
jgi:hypothetical protein